MKKHLYILTFILFSYSLSLRAEQYDIHYFDDSDGLSHWHISQILQDTSGIMWIATWNGLNRFDGHQFVHFKPQAGDAVCMPNDRIRRMRLTPDNNILCLVENRIFLFNTHTCRFDTLLPQQERDVYVQMRQLYNPDFVRPNSAQTYHFGDIVLHNIWESYTDRQSNQWLFDDHGIYSVTHVPARGTHVNNQEVRAVTRMSNGDIWASVRDTRQIIVYDSLMNPRGYVNPKGQIVPRPTDFGQIVYAIYEAPNGDILLGCKPGSLVELMPSAIHTYPQLRNVYDICHDDSGRIWVATFGFGLWREVEPRQFALVPGTDKLFIRRLLILPDGTLLAATNSGILVIDDIHASSPSFRIHKREAGRANSLSSNAIMCLAWFNNTLFVGTEGGGLNRLTTSDMHASQWAFDHITMRDGLQSDIIFELMPWSSSQLLIQGNNALALLNCSDATITTYGESFFSPTTSGRFILGEVPPLMMPNHRVLIAPTDGLLLMDQSALRPDSQAVHIAITALGHQQDINYAVNHCRRITLAPNERSLFISFAALDYRNHGSLRYRTRLYPAGQQPTEWSQPSAVNSISIEDIQPGHYIFEVRSTDAFGHWQSNTRTIHIIVEPTFLESTLGQIIIFIAIFLILLILITLFIRAQFIHRQQAKTLESYLELQERLTHLSHSLDAVSAQPLPTPEILVPGYTSDNERFLNTLHRFIEEHIGDSDFSLDDLAAHTGMSRSSLTRKMRELFNLTPKDFIQAARMKHACQLLQSTEMPTKEIAYSCGYSDPHYFSKCFKNLYGCSPKEYREHHLNP